MNGVVDLSALSIVAFKSDERDDDVQIKTRKCGTRKITIGRESAANALDMN